MKKTLLLALVFPLMAGSGDDCGGGCFGDDPDGCGGDKVTGTWGFRYTARNAGVVAVLNIQQDGSQVTGDYVNAEVSTFFCALDICQTGLKRCSGGSVGGSVSGSDVSLSFTCGREWTFVGTINGDRMEGSNGNSFWRATRQ